MGKARACLRAILDSINEGLGETLAALPCPACQSGEHILCMRPDLENIQCCCAKVKQEFENIESTGKTGPTKEAADITDVQSTGRKRAALMYPIAEGDICEWAGLKNAGGGVVPITGCFDNPATDRHHGPDKNTLNNTAGNVHRICSFCHNFWHAKNDEYYGERPPGTEPFIPLDPHKWCQHDPVTKASPEELVLGQLGRKQPKR